MKLAVEFCRVMARILNGDLEVEVVGDQIFYKLWFIGKIPYRHTVSSSIEIRLTFPCLDQF